MQDEAFHDELVKLLEAARARDLPRAARQLGVVLEGLYPLPSEIPLLRPLEGRPPRPVAIAGSPRTVRNLAYRGQDAHTADMPALSMANGAWRMPP